MKKSSSENKTEDYNDEESLNEIEENENFKKVSNLTIISTNARSLTPKIECFIDYLLELDSSVAFLTETWLTDSAELEKDIHDLELGTGYSIICKNRPPNNRGYSAGGALL